MFGKRYTFFSLLPCGHTFCDDCIEKLRVSGICRGRIDGKIKISYPHEILPMEDEYT